MIGVLAIDQISNDFIKVKTYTTDAIFQFTIIKCYFQIFENSSQQLINCRVP